MANGQIAKLIKPLRLRCVGCGATAEAACDCGVAYVPAGEVAAKAAALNPGLSSGVLADQSGVSDRTIRRAQEATRSNGQVETTTRIGRDGKERVLPQPRSTAPAGNPAEGSPVRDISLRVETHPFPANPPKFLDGARGRSPGPVPRLRSEQACARDDIDGVLSRVASLLPQLKRPAAVLGLGGEADALMAEVEDRVQRFARLVKSRAR